MKTSCRLAALAVSVALWLPAGSAYGLEPAHLVAGFPRGLALLETEGPRCLLIDTYFASTAEQRMRGLMYVESLGEFEGMYFGNTSPVELAMWMKNTVIPLDMLFIRTDGTVGHIARETRPLSTDRITSRGEVAGVLELNAGFARRWRVTSGTRLWLP
ncbi:MAG: DUF192 domain-containing protein [Gammaproteobacteria bacterium]|nr:DUF192 domain-containing protein [Gammaproteobacteria bacterium]